MDSRCYLIKVGFKNVGTWKTSSKTKSGIDFELKSMSKTRVIYAFVVGSSVKYVGNCPRRSLKDRMGSYRSYKSKNAGKTNKQVGEKIAKHLSKDRAVEIYAWIPKIRVKCHGLECDSICGFEGPLIDKLKPEWNN